MSFCGKLPSGDLKEYFGETAIMTRFYEHTVILAGEETFEGLLKRIEQFGDKMAARKLGRFFVGSAVELDLREEYFYVPSVLLEWMRAEKAETLWICKAENLDMGDFILGASEEAVREVVGFLSYDARERVRLLHGAPMPLVMEEETDDWEEEDQEDEE